VVHAFAPVADQEDVVPRVLVTRLANLTAASTLGKASAPLYRPARAIHICLLCTLHLMHRQPVSRTCRVSSRLPSMQKMWYASPHCTHATSFSSFVSPADPHRTHRSCAHTGPVVTCDMTPPHGLAVATYGPHEVLVRERDEPLALGCPCLARVLVAGHCQCLANSHERQCVTAGFGLGLGLLGRGRLVGQRGFRVLQYIGKTVSGKPARRMRRTSGRQHMGRGSHTLHRHAAHRAPRDAPYSQCALPMG
jgi:hypothetical protein